jgi:hypothetical protein
MSCERFHEAIAGDAAGGELDAAAAAHLAACDACAARLVLQCRLLAEVDAELERALAMMASPEFVAGVTARIRPWDMRRAAWRPAAVWIGLAAAAAIAAAAFLRAPVTPAPAASAPIGTAVAVSAPLAAPPPIVEPVVPGVAPRPVTVRRSTAKAPRSAAAAHTEEPPVIVDGNQIRAIARLHELLITGRLDEKTLPPARQHDAAALTIAPLEIPDIRVPEVDAVGRGPGTPPSDGSK